MLRFSHGVLIGRPDTDLIDQRNRDLVQRMDAVISLAQLLNRVFHGAAQYLYKEYYIDTNIAIVPSCDFRCEPDGLGYPFGGRGRGFESRRGASRVAQLARARKPQFDICPHLKFGAGRMQSVIFARRLQVRFLSFGSPDDAQLVGATPRAIFAGALVSVQAGWGWLSLPMICPDPANLLEPSVSDPGRIGLGYRWMKGSRKVSRAVRIGHPSPAYCLGQFV